jgi:4-amino-4-deoxy-L-arabinose transferase-like glycosyltransferase
MMILEYKLAELQTKPRWWAVAGAVGLALALQWGIILGYGFDGLYGQDAYAYYGYSIQLWESIAQLTRPPPFFWPLGYPALVAAGFLLTGFSPLSGQLISSLAGAGVVVLTYALASDLSSRQGAPDEAAHWIGVAASLLAAASGQLWQWSIAVMSDATGLFWATLAAWALVCYGRRRRLRWLMLAAFALAWAMMTRWIYGLLVVPFGVYWALELARTLRSPLARSASPAEGEHPRGMHVVRRLPTEAWHLLAAGLVGVAVLAPQIALSASNPAPVIGHQWIVGWSPLNAVRSEFETVDGRAVYRMPVALFNARPAIWPNYLFPLFTPFLLLGLWEAIRRRWSLVLALVVGWGAVMYGFLSGIPYQNYRFTFVFLPVVAIMTAVGLYHGWIRMARRWRSLLVVYLLAGLIGGIWYSSRGLGDFIARKEADLNVARWVGEQVPTNGRVLSFGITLTLQHYTPLDVHEFFLLSPQDLQGFLDDRRSTYLVVQVDNLESQWPGHPPERNYRWLRDGPGLVPMGTRAGYTLFRVGRQAAQRQQTDGGYDPVRFQRGGWGWGLAFRIPNPQPLTPRLDMH